MSEKETGPVVSFAEVAVLSSQTTTSFYTALLLEKMSGIDITDAVRARVEKEVLKKMEHFSEDILQFLKQWS